MTQPGIAIPTDRGAEATHLDPFFGRRIEEWIVSTLDDRNPSAAGEDWRESLERFTLARRSPSTRNGPATSATQTSPGGWARFRLSRRRGITVVILSDQALIREEDLEELTGDLLALTEAGHRRLVLDFSNVERLSTWAAGSISGVVRRCSGAEGGTVKVAGLRPQVASAFEIAGLGRAVEVCPDTASALEGSWPELPPLRPLPVPILSALLRAGDARPARSEEPPAMSGFRLIIQDGPSTGRPIAIRSPRFVIGRGPDCQLRLGSLKVSRSHAILERRGTRLVLRDLSSTNGTLLNGRRLRDGEAEVRDGDQIRIGPISFALAVGPISHRSTRLEAESASLMPATGEVPDATEEFLSLGGDDEEIGLKAEVIEGTLVVTPLLPSLDGAAEIDAFRDALISLFDRRFPRRVVINLAHVGHLSGQAIGILVAHHLRLDRTGGALRICLANPRVAAVLDHVRLGMLVDCHPSIDDAVVAAWPGAETLVRS
ncbi:STAS domain-containing protein [Tundrisphaera lichenicola]|uniref:STAS domain-containing protein n=1 Tax=Tundrisphaera lichenicola TaxID=2029860 RepID=UPI003EB725E4